MALATIGEQPAGVRLSGKNPANTTTSNITNTNTGTSIVRSNNSRGPRHYSPLARGPGDVDADVLLAREVRAVKIVGGACCDMYNTKYR